MHPMFLSDVKAQRGFAASGQFAGFRSQLMKPATMDVIRNVRRGPLRPISRANVPGRDDDDSRQLAASSLRSADPGNAIDIF